MLVNDHALHQWMACPKEANTRVTMLSLSGVQHGNMDVLSECVLYGQACCNPSDHAKTAVEAPLHNGT